MCALGGLDGQHNPELIGPLQLLSWWRCKGVSVRSCPHSAPLPAQERPLTLLERAQCWEPIPHCHGCHIAASGQFTLALGGAGIVWAVRLYLLH